MKKMLIYYICGTGISYSDDSVITLVVFFVVNQNGVSIFGLDEISVHGIFLI